MVYLPTFTTKNQPCHVGKYTLCPMDAIRWIPLIPPFTWVHLIMHLLQLFSPPWCHQVYTFDKKKNWLVVSTHLKSINQNGNLPQVGMKIKNN